MGKDGKSDPGIETVASPDGHGASPKIPVVTVAAPIWEPSAVKAIERRWKVARQLQEQFDDISFLWVSEEVLDWGRTNRDLLLSALRVPPGEPIKERILSLRRDIWLHLGNYLAATSAALDFLFTYGKDRMAGSVQTAIDKQVALPLKETPVQRLMTLLRNRYLHAPPLLDLLTVQVRRKVHPMGPGIVLCPRPTQRAIAGIDERLPKTGNVRALWDEAIQQMNRSEDWLSPIVKADSQAMEQAFERAKATVSETYMDAVERHQALRDELRLLDKAIQRAGWLRPSDFFR